MPTWLNLFISYVRYDVCRFKSLHGRRMPRQNFCGALASRAAG